MRKLLVASQKSGVGKTTTTINLAGAAALAGARVLLVDADPLGSIGEALNLAGHPRRKPLREFGLDLPGAICAGVLPGLDVLSPYEEGICSDSDLDDLLQLLAAPAIEECYGCLIVGVPPFLGASAGALLGSCDEIVLVMRAEPLASRTLPAFLELINRKKSRAATQLRGILLTLPEGEEPGGRSESELRGRFGARILAAVIPHDEELGRAVESHRVAAQVCPEAPAASQYHALAANLRLAEDKGGKSPVEAVFAAAAAALPVAAGSARRSAFTAEAPETVASAVTLDANPARGAPPPSPVRSKAPAPEKSGRRRALPKADKGNPPSRSRVPTLPPRPPAGPATRKPAGPRPQLGGRTQPAANPAAEPVPTATPVAPSRNAAAARRAGKPTGRWTAFQKVVAANWTWLRWVGLAAAGGVVLRVLKLRPSLLPVGVGVAVTVGVVLVLRRVLARQEAAAEPGSKSCPSAPAAAKKSSARSPATQETSSRLAALARRLPTRRPRDNG